MSKLNNGGPAFPKDGSAYSEGMTLRDYFAAKAMQTFASTKELGDEQVASWAYATADAMLKARAK